MRFSAFVAVPWWLSRFNHTRKLTSTYNYIIQINLEQTGVIQTQVMYKMIFVKINTQVI